MTITYRTTGAWGAGKGANLTPAEVDGNFHDLATRVGSLETDAPQPVNIADITVVGTQMTIVLEDATSFGPFTLPQANFRPAIVATVPDATYQPVLSDGNTYKRCTNAAGCVVTIPANATVAFAVDTEISFRQAAAGAVSFDTPTDVTLNGIAGYLNETAGQGAVVTIKKVGTDEWDIIGFVAQDVTA